MKTERKQFIWRVPEPCDNCPFNETGAGKQLCDSLHPERMDDIKRELIKGGTFMCHKTTPQTGNNTQLLCAGSLRWKKQHGHPPSAYEAWCTALQDVKESKRELLRRLKMLVRGDKKLKKCWAPVSRENGRPANPNTEEKPKR